MAQQEKSQVYDPAPDPSTFITVKTTLPRQPLPPNSERPPFYTDRLVLRALRKEDVHDLHRLRTQPEVMRWTALKKCDESLEETEAKLALYLEPNDARTFNFAICLRETGELVGMGGNHVGGDKSSFGWPEVGYMFLKECWGLGYATEFLRGFQEVWKNGLEREGKKVEAKVDERSVVVVVAGKKKEEEEEGNGGGDGDGVVAEEILIAITAEENEASQRVLRKCGFEEFVRWRDDSEGGTGDVLPCYRWFPGREN